MTWQDDLAHTAAAVLDLPLVVHGSVLTGDLDRSSDLDLAAATPDLSRWRHVSSLDPVGERWAWQTSVDEHSVVHRVVLVDGRWLDLRIVDDIDALPSPHRVLARPPAVRVDRADAVTQPSSGVSDVVVRGRFLAALALLKSSRDDQLIAGHLLLELGRLVLEQAMRARDEALGKTVHRRGGLLNEVWPQVLNSLEFGSQPAAGPELQGARELPSHSLVTGGPATRPGVGPQAVALLTLLEPPSAAGSTSEGGGLPDLLGLTALARRFGVPL